MKRREFITLLGGTATWTIAAQAQQNITARVGILTTATEGEADALARHEVFRTTLATLGWEEGRNIRFDFRWGAGEATKARTLAAELVGLAPNVILAQGSNSADALREATHTIPVVFVGVSDPVGSKVVASIARPGANLTGFTNFEFSIAEKWLEILKEVAPATKRVLVLRTPDDSGNLGLQRTVEAKSETFGVQVLSAGVRTADEIKRAIEVFASERNGGLLVLPGASRRENRDLLVALAERHKLPAIYPLRLFVASGGLMSYDTDIMDLYRRGASYVDRILRGEKAGDLPVQTPTMFELVINLKTAKALGLNVPLALLARADEVIE